MKIFPSSYNQWKLILSRINKHFLLLQRSECTQKNCKDCRPDSPEEFLTFPGKIALITGGTSGIGLATANELLRNGVCHVFVTGIDDCKGRKAVKQLASVYGSKKCSYLHLNVTSEEQFENAFCYIEKDFGGVDILFNNAGILEDKKWELEVEINFKAMIRANLLGLKFMERDEESDNKSHSIILNNADVCAFDPLPAAPIYSATKCGVLGITKCFGSKYHFEKSGVRVVGLCCSATDTRLVKEAARKQLTPKLGEDTINALCRKRLLQPDAVARGIIYIIRHAPNNTIWTIEDSTLFQTDIPNKSLYSFEILHL